ncbi:hypothetical protein QNH28_18395 [Paenibacillus sp. G2S3]|uniref:hypothetical protein n=1 Tax=Paenibacillus sp. G2S3 TaxID=3047872 RepID=UPI0024C108EB|nr:hypothetical protein [Paenibacillus sp. G2S3]WHY17465.1 hypothetical protein QNH28_18395 [Paenibacillus sp. G2S3]
MRKRNNNSVLAAVAVLSIVLLAGCTELPGRQSAKNEVEQSISEDAQQNIGEVVKQELGKAAATVQQAVEETATKVVDEVKADSISKDLSVSQAIGSASVLSMDNAVGEIEVTAVAGDQIHVIATISSHNSSLHKSDRQKIMDDAEVSVEVSGDTLKVSTHSKSSPKKDLWTWAQDKYGYSDFTISYNIELPASMNEYKITNNVGQIRLRNLEGKYHIVSNVGAINIEGAKFTGKSTVESDTGSIRMDIAAMKDNSSLKAKTQVGSLSAVLADGMKCSLEAKSELGQIKGVEGGKTDINGGGPLLSLSSEIGAITVQ